MFFRKRCRRRIYDEKTIYFRWFNYYYFCDSRPDVIFVFYTGSNQFYERYSIHSTIGQLTFYNNVTSKVLFFLGSSKNETIMNLVEAESEKYRDIV